MNQKKAERPVASKHRPWEMNLEALGLLAMLGVILVVACRRDVATDGPEPDRPQVVKKAEQEQAEKYDAAVKLLDHALAGSAIADPTEKAAHFWPVVATAERETPEIVQYGKRSRLRVAIDFGATAYDWSVIRCWPMDGDPVGVDAMVSVCATRLYGLPWEPAKEWPGLMEIGPFGSDLIEGEAVDAETCVEVRFRLKQR